MVCFCALDVARSRWPAFDFGADFAGGLQCGSLGRVLEAVDVSLTLKNQSDNIE